MNPSTRKNPVTGDPPGNDLWTVIQGIVVYPKSCSPSRGRRGQQSPSFYMDFEQNPTKTDQKIHSQMDLILLLWPLVSLRFS